MPKLSLAKRAANAATRQTKPSNRPQLTPYVCTQGRFETRADKSSSFCEGSLDWQFRVWRRSGPATDGVQEIHGTTAQEGMEAR